MKKIIVAGLVLALTGFTAQAKEWKEIRFATEGAYPPFNETAADGSVKGFDVDIGNAICAAMKAKCVWVKQEWDGMIPALMSRKYDAILASMSITEERKKKVDFSDKYYASPLALVAKEGSPLLPTAASLKGKKVGVQRGTVSDNFATKFWEPNGVTVVRYAKQEEAYLDLSSGRMDAGFADMLEALGGFINKPEGKGFAFVGEQVFGKTAEERGVIGEGIGIAVRKKDQELKAKLNKAIAEIRANGTYDTIRKQYFAYDIFGQ